MLGAVALLASGWRFPGRPRTATTLAAGVSSGFLNGLAGMAGPPIAFYYLAGDETVTRVRANLTTYFVFVDLVALAMFAVARPGRLAARACRRSSWRRPSCWAACWAGGCFRWPASTSTAVLHWSCWSAWRSAP